MLEYHESVLLERLGRVPVRGLVAFGASCAERLFPLYVRYDMEKGGFGAPGLRSALDLAWRFADGEDPAGLMEATMLAESLIPDEDGDDLWIHELPYAANCAAAVVYALEVAVDGDAQKIAWCARQVYEAADYPAQQAAPDYVMFDPEANRAISESILASGVVQEALAAIEADLVVVEQGSTTGWAALRERAEEEGQSWGKHWP